MIAGIMVRFWGLSATTVCPALIAFSFLWVMFAPGEQKAHGLLLVFIVLFGYHRFQSAAEAPEAKSPRTPITQWIDDGEWYLTGAIDSLVKRSPEKTRFVIKADSVSRGQVSHLVTGRVRMTVWDQVEGIYEGDRIVCLAKLREIRNFNNPGGFDYKQHMLFQHIVASASVSSKTFVKNLGAAEANPFWKQLLRCRNAVFFLLEQAPAGASRGLVKALVMGDRSEISSDVRDMFCRMGVSHVLAISGLHMGMLATMTFFLFRWLLSFSERLLTGGWSIRIAAMLCVVPILVYGALAGRTPATERAVIMVVLFLFAIVLAKETDAINTLASAATVILMASPCALFDISFQLSFSAVLSILYIHQRGYAIFLPNTSPLAPFLKRPVQFLVVSLAAMLGTLPLTLLYFNQMSFIGLAGNCIMVPLVGFGAVPVGLIAVFILPFTESGALWILERTIQLLDLCFMLVEPLERVAWVSARTVTPTILEIGLYYGAMWSFLNLRRSRAAKVLLLVVVCVSAVDGAYWLQRRFFHQDLRITYLDVGQGNAALIELPGGECMLVDGGGSFKNRFDVGRNIVAPFLWSKKIGRIDTLVLSHPHPDHLNGLLFIAHHFHVREVWMNEDTVNNAMFYAFKKTLTEKGIKKVTLDASAEPRTIGGVRCDILYPPKGFLAQRALKRWRTTNNNSLVLKVSKGGVSFLFPDDIEKEAEKELVATAKDRLRSHVLLAPHHGSKTSSTLAFLKTVNPEIAVASAGWKNRFGLPHKKVLRRYEALGCRVYRTDTHGAVKMITAGHEIHVIPFLRQGPNG